MRVLDGGTLMRHFLVLATAIPGLSGRVLTSALVRGLMAPTRAAQRLASRLVGASLRAVDLAAVTPTTNQRHLLTARAPESAQRKQLRADPAARATGTCPAPPAVAVCRVETHARRVDVSQRLAWFPGRCRVAALSLCSHSTDGAPSNHRSTQLPTRVFDLLLSTVDLLVGRQTASPSSSTCNRLRSTVLVDHPVRFAPNTGAF